MIEMALTIIVEQRIQSVREMRGVKQIWYYKNNTSCQWFRNRNDVMNIQIRKGDMDIQNRTNDMNIQIRKDDIDIQNEEDDMNIQNGKNNMKEKIIKKAKM